MADRKRRCKVLAERAEKPGTSGYPDCLRARPEGLPGCNKQRLPADAYPAVLRPYAAQQPEIVLWKDYRAVTSGLKATVSGTNRRVSANAAGCVLRNVGRQVSANQQKLACARGKSQYILRLSIRYPQSHLSAPAALPLRRPHLHLSEISLHGSPDIPTKIIRYSQCPGRRPLNRLSDTKSILQHCSTYAR